MISHDSHAHSIRHGNCNIEWTCHVDALGTSLYWRIQPDADGFSRYGPVHGGGVHCGCRQLPAGAGESAVLEELRAHADRVFGADSVGELALRVA